MMEISYINAEMSRDFEESIRLGAEAGAHTVDLRGNIWGNNIEKISDEDVKRIKEVLSQYDMRVGMLLPPVGKCDIENPEDVQKHTDIFRKMTKLAHELDTNLIRTFPFRRPGYEEYEPSHLDEYLPRIVEHFAPIVEIAAGEGVIACLECVGSTLARSAQDIRRVIDALGNPSAVSVIWEIDVACKDGEVPSEGYPHVRGLIREVHVKPNPDHFTDPDDGHMDAYERAFRLLAADSYHGLATIEHWESKEGTLEGIHWLKELLSMVGGG